MSATSSSSDGDEAISTLQTKIEGLSATLNEIQTDFETQLQDSINTMQTSFRKSLETSIETKKDEIANMTTSLGTTWMDSMMDEVNDNMDNSQLSLVLLGAGGFIFLLWATVVCTWSFVASPDSAVPLPGLRAFKYEWESETPIRVACSNPGYAYDNKGLRYKIEWKADKFEDFMGKCINEKSILPEVDPVTEEGGTGGHVHVYHRQTGGWDTIVMWAVPPVISVCLAVGGMMSQPPPLDFKSRSKDARMWVIYRDSMKRKFRLKEGDNTKTQLENIADEAWKYLNTRKNRLSDGLKLRVSNKTHVDDFLKMCAQEGFAYDLTREQAKLGGEGTARVDVDTYIKEKK